MPKREEASVIFIYSLTHLAVKDKVRFYYALKGRDGKSGIIKQYNIEQLAKSVLIIDKKQEQQLEDFLKFWKCEYRKKEVFINE